MQYLKRDCEIDFYTGTGKGGQHRNKHANCVRIRHLSTGIIVTAAEQRSQSMNLKTAWERLAVRLKQYSYKKPKRIPTKTTWSAKERTHQVKAKVAEKKKFRSKVSKDEW